MIEELLLFVEKFVERMKRQKSILYFRYRKEL